MLLGCHLCWLSGCNWVLFVVGSFFLLDPNSQLITWELLCPPCLLCCCAGAARRKPQSPGNKPTSAKISPLCNLNINSKWISININVKRLRLLWERREINYSINSSDLIFINLPDKKWMLKSYAGKIILLILEKTIVDFVLVVSSIYHCFFFLDPPLVILDVDPAWP